MNDKKLYFIVGPSNRTKELADKATEYYGTKDYDNIVNSKVFSKILSEAFDSEFDNSNASKSFNVMLMLIGVSSMSMSMCDSVYMSKDWENDDYCKTCHALAFAQGLEIVYES